MFLLGELLANIEIECDARIAVLDGLLNESDEGGVVVFQVVFIKVAGHVEVIVTHICIGMSEYNK